LTDEEMSDDKEEDSFVNFFLIHRYALYGVSVRLYVRPDILIVSRTFAQVR
jgi:hypothetical protein